MFIKKSTVVIALCWSLQVSYALSPVSVPHTFNNGQVADADDVNENFSAMASGINTNMMLVPVGSILPWHKNPKNEAGSELSTPNLSEHWVECNGQILNDPESPLHGMKVPDLNGSDPNSGRFLRGGTESGITQDHALQDHRHNSGSHSHSYSFQPFNLGGGGTSAGWSGTGAWTSQNTSSSHVPILGATNANVASETRPVNMSVVWIIRVK